MLQSFFLRRSNVEMMESEKMRPQADVDNSRQIYR
jgi:hypothetical protein